MSESSLFMPKKKDRVRRQANRPVRSGPVAPAVAGPSTSTAGTTLPRHHVGLPKSSIPVASSSSSPAADEDVKPNPNVTEIKLYSTDPGSGQRFSIMKFMSARDFDPTQITRPILMNRKFPGPRELPVHALDDEGKIVGRYIYDDAGKPVLGANGQPTIERKDVGMDPDLVGGVPGQKRKLKKGVKEVFHQDIEVIRMKREEAVPWVLETARPRSETQSQQLGHVPEHWVGRMTEANSLPTVLLINDGRLESGFEVVPLGRTYRFNPERPFKTLDSEAANKLFESQMKNKVHDRWALRPDGPALMGSLPGPSVKVERDDMMSRWETRMRGAQAPRVKAERYEDDFKREGRQQERGMEGGIDEELDYDVADEFQDDDENNTFYRDQEEEEETKYQEEQIKKEQRLANANVGDRPQIDDNDDDDEDDLFGDGKLNSEGKRLRKMIRDRDGDDDYDSSDSESSSSETIKDDKSEKSTKEDKEKEKDVGTPTPGSADRPSSRPPSRGPGHRNTTSPGGRRPNLPPGKAGTAPPGSGAAFLAQRATGSRAGSPKARSRGASPHSRAGSPENRDGRGMSPPSRGGSPSRALSPPLSGRAGSPSTGREGSPAAAGQPRQGQQHSVKRRTTTASPQPGAGGAGPSSNSPKRKPSPTPSNGSTSEPRSKKKKSSTPDVAPFPGQITLQEVLQWFHAQPSIDVQMSAPIRAFKPKLLATPGEHKDANQKLFMRWIYELATKNDDGKSLTLKPSYRK